MISWRNIRHSCSDPITHHQSDGEWIQRNPIITLFFVHCINCVDWPLPWQHRENKKHKNKQLWYYLWNTALSKFLFKVYCTENYKFRCYVLDRYGNAFHRHIEDARIKRATKAEGVRCVILVHSFNVASSYTFCYASSDRLLNFPNKQQIFHRALESIECEQFTKKI